MVMLAFNLPKSESEPAHRALACGRWVRPHRLSAASPQIYVKYAQKYPG